MKNEKGFIDPVTVGCLLAIAFGVSVASGAIDFKNKYDPSKLKTGVAEYVTNN